MDEIETKIREIIFDYLRGASPEAWHRYVAGSNYDDNHDALRWLIDQPELDVGTARQIYWNSGAAWYAQFSSEAELEGYQREAFLFLKSIEERVAGGFYRNAVIWFDPMHGGGGRPDDYPDLPVKRPVPAVMLEASGTENVDLDEDGWDEGLPFAVAERIQALFDQES